MPAKIILMLFGMVVISYFDRTNSTLKVAHCGNAFCQANVRRR